MIFFLKNNSSAKGGIIIVEQANMITPTQPSIRKLQLSKTFSHFSNALLNCLMKIPYGNKKSIQNKKQNLYMKSN